MAQQLEPVTFDEFLSNAASIFAQVEQEGKGVLVEHDTDTSTNKHWYLADADGDLR